MRAMVLVACLSLIACGASEDQTANSRFDILIKNGRVVDGAGNPWWQADVGVTDGRIARVGNLASATGTKTIEADGLVVSPGFIDIHNHSDWTLLINPKAESMIRQGVTTMAVGQCGSSGGPTGEGTFGEFLAALAEQGVATNVAPFIGHGTIRGYVIGDDDRTPTTEELEEMKGLAGAIMPQAMKLTVPLKVDVKLGKNWGEMK